jgi:hypothetical protein
VEVLPLPYLHGSSSKDLVPARPDDLIVIDSPQVGSLPREGEALQVIQGEVSVSYRVQWADGHQSLFAPMLGSSRIGRRRSPSSEARAGAGRSDARALGPSFERHRPEAVDPDPQHTVARLRVVAARVDPPEAVEQFLEALLAYFGTVSDLIQRQEHGAQKEGEMLSGEDARRVAFQTLISGGVLLRAVENRGAASE